jgi:uncharacterized RDD family membrane protein YckC
VQPADTHKRGTGLGLPASGPGSRASTNKRILALLIDCAAAGLVAGLFTAALSRHGGVDALPGNWSLVPLLVDYVIGLSLVGRTLGMNLVGIRVIRAEGAGRVSPLAALVRTLLLGLLIPAIIWDKDGRGLHDRLAGTVVVEA